MIREVKREKEGLYEKKLKEVIAGLTEPHGNCSCDWNCGTKLHNDHEHSDNDPL